MRNFTYFFFYLYSISDIPFFPKNILNFIENLTKYDKIANEKNRGHSTLQYDLYYLRSTLITTDH
jgi:hypothetical protein